MNPKSFRGGQIIPTKLLVGTGGGSKILTQALVVIPILITYLEWFKIMYIKHNT
jgi:hypothetical protein